MKKQRNRAGFTMSEVLLTIAILAVLAAVAIPGVLAARRQLKMMELNDTAREIFLAAQNTLTARRAAGTVFPASGEKEDDTGLYWLDQKAPGYLLPTGAIEAVAAGNYYQIRYNPKTATVLEVYYAEQDLPADLRSGGYSNNAEEGPALRRAEKIGYYNGKDLELSEIDELPSLSSGFLVNKEELYVYFEIDPEYVPLVKLILTVDELGADGKTVVPDHSQEFTIDPTSTDSPAKFDPVTGELKLVLDSLTDPNFQFKTRCPNITPGSDIKVTAQLVPSNADGKDWIAPEPIWDTDNSLFGERNPSEEREMAYIAYPRHLQNLEPSFSNVDWLHELPSGKTAPAVYVTKAQQIDKITWPTAPDFTSINNAKLNSYNGDSKEIKNLHGANGLFAEFTGNLLKDVHIVDPVIQNSSVNTGVLAGEAKGESKQNGTEYVYDLLISGCRVYVTPKADGNYGDIGISASAANVGGLIGHAYHCTISDSFAALPAISNGNGYLGGLIGGISECKISNCYAVVDQLHTGGGIAGMFAGQNYLCPTDSCYAVGNLYGVGNKYGFSQYGTISNSYCAVTYNDSDGKAGTPSAAFGGSAANQNCFYLSTGGTDSYAAPLSYADMSGGVNMPGQWTPIDATKSHPYRPELSGKAYPFPALKDAKGPLPHYGSWPVQTVDAIKAFRTDLGDEEVDYLICPFGGSISFWAEPCSGDQPVDVRVDEPYVSYCSNNTMTGVRPYLGSDESGGSRTQITLEGNQPGVYAVQVSADGVNLWVPVIVCKAEMTLTGKNNDELKVSNIATLNGQSASAVLPLRTGMQAEFSAVLAVDPTCATVNTGMAALYTDASTKKIPVTAQSWVNINSADWLGFRVVQNGKMEFGPGVTLNDEVADGVYHLQPKVLDDGKPHALYQVGSNGPTPGTSDTLTVTGQSAGTATVSVCWAMDSRLTVNGNIEVSGTRAFIYSAEANANNATGRTLGYKDNYPYHLAIKPAPKEAVTLTFTGKLFGAAPTGMKQAWDWIITDENGTEMDRTSKELAPGVPPPDAFTVELKNYAPHARYKVQMTYKYGTDLHEPTYVTSDFMYVTVSRTTVGEDENNIDLTLKDDIVLEQINWGEQVARPADVTGDLNKATISGHVDGAADSRLLWYLGTDENKKQITGPMTVLDNGVPIATLDWTMMPNGDSGVIIEALDSDYYGDTPLTFTLLAAAQDNDDAPETKAVQVSIMPKLLLAPQSKVATGLAGVTTTTFTANRTDKKYNYEWTCDRTDATLTANNTHVSTLKTDLSLNSSVRTYKITLKYGPFCEQSLLTAKWYFSGFETSINWDGQASGREYFLVEKGKTKDLQYAWGHRSNAYKINSHPSAPEEVVTIIPGTGDTGAVASGTFNYSVTGVQFSNRAVELKWGMSNNSVATYNLYVVGTEFTQNGQPITDELVITGQTGTAQVKLSGYFPAAVGTGTLTVTSDRPQVASFKTATEGGAAQLADSLSFSPGETGIDQTITLQAHKYGTTLITATYKIGDREYSDTFSLRVEPPEGALHVKLEVCNEGDRYDLEKLFGKPNEHLAAYADYGDAQTPNFIPTLLSEPAFGMDTLYLKACLTDGSKILDPAGYIHEIVATVDNARVAAIETPKDADGKPMLLNNTLYIKLTSHNGALSGDDVTVTAHFGTLSGKQPVRVYSEPSVVIRDESGAVVTNGHTVIDGFGADTEKKTYRFRAELYPRLQKRTVEDDGSVTYAPLDGLVWFPEFPSDNYQADAFLTLKPDGDGCGVEIKASPGCKVAINVQSKLANAANSELSKSAHALVFIPKKNP